MDFLIQYDTESIISDWYRVLSDTIRQLVRAPADLQLTLTFEAGVSLHVAAPQEYQEQRSDEEDSEIYEKVATPEGGAPGEKFGSGGDKRRRESDAIIFITYIFIFITSSSSASSSCSSSLQAQRGPLV